MSACDCSVAWLVGLWMGILSVVFLPRLYRWRWGTK